MYFNRLIDNILNEWKEKKERYPLLIRGARQIGKSTTIRELGKKFQTFIEINFDQYPEIAAVFEKNLDINRICNELALITGQRIVEGKTLIFFDEIQLAPRAISSLRYFYETKPNLHVIATGSLLEFTLSELPSFGLGRVQSIYMYAFNFYEYLIAIDENMLIDAINGASIENPLPEVIHKKLLDLFIRFQIVGGMPKALAAYKKNGDFLEARKVLSTIVNEYETDFSKYKKRIPAERLTTILKDVALQVGNKFTYKNLRHIYNYSQIKECIYYLIQAGLIIPVYHTSAIGIPLGASKNEKIVKYLIFDSGIYFHLLNEENGYLLLEDYNMLINKGGLADMMVGLEFLKSGDIHNSPHLYFWQRDKIGSQAELDYIRIINKSIVPIEVKSSGKGAMKSMHLFMSEKKKSKGLRISMENYGHSGGIDIVPIYASCLY